ncbi:MAG: GNAT family N-acetyltransferase [Cyanobacteria bacterium P01_A01_bin.105]
MHPSPQSEINLGIAPLLRCSALSEAQLPAVLALDKLCLGGLWTEAGYRREIESPNSDLLIVELASPHAPPLSIPSSPHPSILGLGCLWSILDEAHITTLAIHPDYHRGRLGQWLLVQLLTAAHHRQLTHATLEVRVSNTPAERLYQKFGFQIAGRRKRYYADDEDAWVLGRSGLQTDLFVQDLQKLSLESEQAILQRGWCLR